MRVKAGHSADMAAPTETFHLDDMGDIQAHLASAGEACPVCGTPENVVGWRFRTSRRGMDVFQCPTCKQNVAVMR